MQETWVPSLGWEDPLEKEMVTHSSILACTYSCHHYDTVQMYFLLEIKQILSGVRGEKIPSTD